MESKWVCFACINTPTLVHIDFEGIKYFPSKSKTLSPALHRRWEKPMSDSYQPPQRNSASVCSGFNINHSLSFIFSSLRLNPIPTHSCSGSLQKLSLPLQASPSASENLDLITNVFLMHWWKHLFKIISFSLREFSIKQTHNNYFL